LCPLGILVAVLFAAHAKDSCGIKFFSRLCPWAQRDYVLPDITDNNGMNLPALLLKLRFKLFGVLDA